MEPGTISSVKRNVLATNSSIQNELKAALIKKNIE